MTGDISAPLSDGVEVQRRLAAVAGPGPVDFVVEWCLPPLCPPAAEDPAHGDSPGPPDR
ncbi:MAG: hypothetical protein ABR540_18035 [Acidimicrobiales bacterium]|nr:hypothetical protein [Actinomycetota bacterium]